MENKFYFLYPAAAHPSYSAVLNIDKAKWLSSHVPGVFLVKGKLKNESFPNNDFTQVTSIFNTPGVENKIFIDIPIYWLH